MNSVVARDTSVRAMVFARALVTPPIAMIKPDISSDRPPSMTARVDKS